MTGGSESGPSIGLSYRRYRRRILGWGAVVLAAVFAVGAALTLGRVEDDLADRVVEVIDEQGIAGVRVTFSGQDGTLECAEPFGDPVAMEDLTTDVRGVRSIDLEESCVPPDDGGDAAGAATSDEPTDPTGTAGTAAVVVTDPTIPEPAGSALVTASSSLPGPEVRTVMDVLGADPQFSAVLSAVEASGLAELVDQAEPFTAFAPSNAAFDALSPQVAGALNADPALLDAVLQNHVTLGVFGVDDLVSGPLEMVGGATVLVDAESSPPTLTSGSIVGRITDGDIEVTEGVVHVIDQLLIPPDLGLATTTGEPVMDATFEGGVLILDGVVASDAARASLTEVAQEHLADANVIDQLVVGTDADGPETTDDVATDDDVATVAEVLPAMTTSLASGTAEAAAAGVTVTGVVVDDDARSALETAAEAAGAMVELRDRPVVGAGDLVGDAGVEAVAANQATVDAILDESSISFEGGEFAVAGETPATLDRLAAAIKSLGGTTVIVEGYTTPSGNEVVDFLLSGARAGTVRDELVARGVPEGQLEAVAGSVTEPADQVAITIEEP